MHQAQRQKLNTAKELKNFPIYSSNHSCNMQPHTQCRPVTTGQTRLAAPRSSSDRSKNRSGEFTGEKGSNRSSYESILFPPPSPASPSPRPLVARSMVPSGLVAARPSSEYSLPASEKGLRERLEGEEGRGGGGGEEREREGIGKEREMNGTKTVLCQFTVHR